MQGYWNMSVLDTAMSGAIFVVGWYGSGVMGIGMAAFTSEADAEACCRKYCEESLADCCGIERPYPEGVADVMELLRKATGGEMRVFIRQIVLNAEPVLGTGEPA